ncbi:hypothetical protein [Nesterenkonia aerolata]|uniref:AMP-dependent synthetase/ligase domain-containing protein n=1 Tax=Nesterenkonia aerolata TaxID=3074079 RepID=A0ABU2DQV3_9MICC|nr:hypothetical protein [Nesterenkonia sp. LY-0111]MDR8018882.1 hypothetical protein [Nesterenkonia sp. LY-0111]
MPPLNLGPHSAPVAEDHPGLLRLLAARPGPALIWHDPDATSSPRVELSGRVLENWTVKMIGLFTQEADLQAGDLVLIDAAPHWKAAAALLAASALGCQVRLVSGYHRAEAAEPALVLTDAPQLWEHAQALGEAELAAFSPGLLDASYEDAVGEPLPSWVIDVSAEVRQQPDQLLIPLPDIGLPDVTPPNVTRPDVTLPEAARSDAAPAGRVPATRTGCLVVEDTAPGLTDGAGWAVRRWWDDDLPALMLGTWAQSGRAVLWRGATTDAAGQPRPQWRRMLEEESVPSSGPSSVPSSPSSAERPSSR